MAPAVVQRIQEGMLNYAPPVVEVIVAGIDEGGPHLWTVLGGVTQYNNMAGYACIGGGWRHAASQMMNAPHSPENSVTEVAALVHLAKTRAEVAPGVGTQTDMLTIGPNLGDHWIVDFPTLSAFEKTSKAVIRAEAKALKRMAPQFLGHVSAKRGKSQQAPDNGPIPTPGPV